MRYHFADCVLDEARRALTRGSEPQQLEPQVFDLLLLLLKNADRVVTRDEMIDVVWNGRIVSDSAISARIAAVRKAVGDTGKDQRVIRTLHRSGLQFVADIESGKNALPEVAAPGNQRIRYTQNANGHSVAYSITGKGSPVVRGGHNVTDLEAEWNTPCERVMFDRLATHHRLLRFDPVGFGRSERSVQTVSFDAIAEDLRTATEAAEFDRFALYSESGGALCAIRFAARYPERVSKLAVVGGYTQGRKRRKPGGETDPLRAMIAEGWEKSQSGFVPAFLFSYFPEGPLEAVRDMARNMKIAASEDMILQMRDAIDNDSILEYLPRITCPTLIIHARHDSVHPLSEAQKLAAGIPDAELLVLETANHVPIPGNPVWDVYADALADFFADKDV